MKALLLVTAALTACSTATVPPPATPTPATAPAPTAPPAVQPATSRTVRFDELVRQDFFDGLRGDTAALDRAMKLCESTLADHPDNAEAMVWHGAGLVARSSLKFRAGQAADAMPLWQKGLAEMDKAVELAPDKVGVRIPRGAVLLGAGPFAPEPQRSQLLAKAASDYEATLAIQQPRFKSLTLHAREQLLYGLVDAYADLGQLDRARELYARMQRDAGDSALLARAGERAAGHAVAGETPCAQCHGR